MTDGCGHRERTRRRDRSAHSIEGMAVAASKLWELDDDLGRNLGQHTQGHARQRKAERAMGIEPTGKLLPEL